MPLTKTRTNERAMIMDVKGSVIFAGVTGITTLTGTAIDNSIGPDTTMSIGSVLAVVGVVVSGTWWVGRKFKAQDTMHRANQHEFKQIKRVLRLLCVKQGVRLQDLIDVEEETEQEKED